MINPEDTEKESKGQGPGARLLAVRKLLNFSTLGSCIYKIRTSYLLQDQQHGSLSWALEIRLSG